MLRVLVVEVAFCYEGVLAVAARRVEGTGVVRTAEVKAMSAIRAAPRERRCVGYISW